MRRLAPLLLLAASVLLGACGGAKDHVEPPAELVTFHASVKPQRLWSRDISDSDNRRRLAFRPWLGDAAVFAAEPGGRVSALARDNGRLLWQRELGLALSAGVGGDNSRVYVASEDGVLLALSVADGSEIWRAQLSTEVLAPPAAAFDVVVARSIDGRISALDAENGIELWSVSRKVPTLTLRGNAPPQMVTGGVLLGLDSGRLLALSLDSGRVAWEARLGSAEGRSEIERLADADAAVATDRLYIYAANYQGVVARVDPRNGELLWRREISTVRRLSESDGQLLATDEFGHVWSLDTDNGATLWKQDKLTARYVTGATPHGEHLVVGDLQGYLHWLVRSDGRFAARFQHSGHRILATPVAGGDTLFVQDAKGRLSAYRLPDGTE